MIRGYTKQCSVCGKRKAIYYHNASGNRLCSRCLSKYLVRSIHRAFGKYQLVDELNPRLIYLFDACLLPLSLYMYYIFVLSEKYYVKNINILINLDVSELIRGVKDIANKNKIDAIIDTLTVKCNNSLPERIRLLRAETIKYIEKNNIIKNNKKNNRIYIVMPLPREYIIAVFLAYLATTRHHYVADLLPRYETREEIATINPFYDSSTEDIIAYGEHLDLSVGYVDSLVTQSRTITREFFELLERVALPRGGELIYTFTKVHQTLAKEILRNRIYSKCRLCGGLEYAAFLDKHEGLCRICTTTNRKNKN